MSAWYYRSKEITIAIWSLPIIIYAVSMSVWNIGDTGGKGKRNDVGYNDMQSSVCDYLFGVHGVLAVDAQECGKTCAQAASEFD